MLCLRQSCDLWVTAAGASSVSYADSFPKGEAKLPYGMQCQNRTATQQGAVFHSPIRYLIRFSTSSMNAPKAFGTA